MKTNKLKLGILLFLITTIACVSCSKNKETDPAEAEKEDFIQAVRVENFEPSNLRKFIELNGNIRAEKSMNVYPIVSGKITGTPVHLGSTVKKGDTVAYVDPSIPGSRYSINEVVSPISGTVISIPLKEGTRVDTETAVLVIGDLSQLQIISYIPERYVSFLKKGLQADVFLEAYPDEVFSATVSEVSPVLDEATRTKEVLLTFTKSDNRINAGMFASIKLYLKNFDKVLSVPTSCIVSKENDKFIYLTEDSKGDGKNCPVKLVKITTKEEIQNRTIVLLSEEETLSSTTKVITQGFETLQDGSIVNIAK